MEYTVVCKVNRLLRTCVQRARGAWSKVSIQSSLGWCFYLLSYCSAIGRWSKWKVWKRCSHSCGEAGISTTYRVCRSTSGRSADRVCLAGDGSLTRREEDRRFCNREPCPVNGGWSEWGAYGSGQCTGQCGQADSVHGSKRMERFCMNPRPQYGGKRCTGPNKRTVRCTCPVVCDSIRDVEHCCKKQSLTFVKDVDEQGYCCTGCQKDDEDCNMLGSASGDGSAGGSADGPGGPGAKCRPILQRRRNRRTTSSADSPGHHGVSARRSADSIGLWGLISGAWLYS